MITGSIVALVTPMAADGSLDLATLERLVEWHIQEGTDAIVAVGTTGESATLDMSEHIEVMRCVIKVSGGRIPVIAGTGANSTSEAIELTRAAQDLGADAALLVTPYYNKPPQEGLFQHFKKVSELTDIPIILYNVPGRTGVDMLPATVARLATLPRIIGIKEAKGEMSRVNELVALDLGDDFALYSGDDPTARESILAGFVGDISVTANVAPRLMHEMCAAALRRDRVRAGELDQQLLGLHQSLFVEPNPIPVKWALRQMQKIPPGIRLPLVPLADTHHESVRSALRNSGALS
ncbi:MAG: 4-hydroxy-tetrahydrodipicolinate synthase [Panacagrimonas sp.]